MKEVVCGQAGVRSERVVSAAGGDGVLAAVAGRRGLARAPGPRDARPVATGSRTRRVFCEVVVLCEGAQRLWTRRSVSQTRGVGRVVALEHRAHARAAGKPQRRHVGGTHSLAATLSPPAKEQRGGKEKRNRGLCVKSLSSSLFLSLCAMGGEDPPQNEWCGFFPKPQSHCCPCGKSVLVFR